MSLEGPDTNYEYVTEPDINLICSICHNAFIEPVTTTTCQHTFCKDCILEAVKVQSQCPIDRSALSPTQIRGAGSALQGILDDLKVRCGIPGCGQEYQRSLHVGHRATCDEVVVNCPNERCEESMKRSFLAHHLAEACPMRSMSCDVCKETITATNIWRHQHLPAQSDVPVNCNFCKQDIERSDVGPHRWKCDKAVVSCPHARHGCPTVTTRAELGAHVKTCPYEHIASHLSGMNRRLTQMEEAMRRFEIRLTRQNNVSSDLTELRLGMREQSNMLTQMDAMVGPMWRLMGVPASNYDNLRNELSRHDGPRPEEITISAPGPHANPAASASDRSILRHAESTVPWPSRNPHGGRRRFVWPTPGTTSQQRDTSAYIGPGASPLRAQENSRSRSDTELHARPDLMWDEIQHGRIPSLPLGPITSDMTEAEADDERPSMRGRQQAIRMAPPRPARSPIPQIRVDSPAHTVVPTLDRPQVSVATSLDRSTSLVERQSGSVDAPAQGPRVLQQQTTVDAAPSALPGEAPQSRSTSGNMTVSDYLDAQGEEQLNDDDDSPLVPQTPNETVSPLPGSARLTASDLWRSQRPAEEQRHDSGRSYQGREMGGHFSLNQSTQPQSFAGLAFSRLGFPALPAQPSGAQEVDDQLGDLRGIIYRLAEGMDTMERQNQARNVTENLRVQEEVSSLRAIVQVMRNQVMMGTQAQARAVVLPQTPTSSTAATDFETPSSTPIRESIAFSSQHADLDGPSETSSVSSLITAVNPIRRPRASMWGRGLGQPMGIPPELDDGAPTVRVEVHTSAPSIETSDQGSRRSRGQRGQSVLDRLHLRGSRSSRNINQQ